MKLKFQHQYTSYQSQTWFKYQGFQSTNSDSNTVSNTELIGHEGAVCIVSFSRRIYEPLASDGPDSSDAGKNIGIGKGASKKFQMFALGSHDKRVSVWKVGVPTPLVVVQVIYVSYFYIHKYFLKLKKRKYNQVYLRWISEI